jgi:hypothetical protein
VVFAAVALAPALYFRVRFLGLLVDELFAARVTLVVRMCDAGYCLMVRHDYSLIT